MARYTSTYVFPWHREWTARVESIDVRRGSGSALARLARSAGPAILHGASGFNRGYVDLIAAAMLARRGAPVLLAEATWQPGSRALDRLLKAPAPVGFDGAPRYGRGLGRRAIGMLDRANVHYAVLSRHELVTFPQVWESIPVGCISPPSARRPGRCRTSRAATASWPAATHCATTGR